MRREAKEAKLTNSQIIEIIELFKSRYPSINVSDYRPLCAGFVKGKRGVVIWLDNGDMIVYVPKAE